MPLDTNKSHLTEISNSADTLHVRNYISSPGTNKHQTHIDNKTVPKLSSAMPPPPPSPTTTTPQPPPLCELESDELLTNFNETGTNSNETKMQL